MNVVILDSGFLKNVHTGKCMDINECEAIPGISKVFSSDQGTLKVPEITQYHLVPDFPYK